MYCGGNCRKKRIALEKLKRRKLESKNNAKIDSDNLHDHKLLSATVSANITKTSQNVKRNHNGSCIPLIHAINNNSAKKVNSGTLKVPWEIGDKSGKRESYNQNKASSFLNAIKNSHLLTQKHQNHQQDSSKEQETSNLKDDRQYDHKNRSNDGTYCTSSTINTTKKLQSYNFLKTVACKIYMINCKRFEVQPSSYNSQLIEVFKTIPSRIYDNNTKCWNFALHDYHLLQDRALPLKPDVVIGAIPKLVLNLCNSPPTIVDKSCLVSIEPTLVEKLLPFQKDGVCFAIGQQGRALICDEMGLGKTYQAIAIADFYKEDWPLLICTTASTRDNWAKELRELLPSIPLHYIQILNSNQQYINDAKILITSYSMMERYIVQLMECKFGFLIFDESHSLKNSKAKCTMGADRLSKSAKRVLLLSGTPALSRPVELYSQLQMIDRKFMSFTEFTARYCDGKQTKFGWDANGQSNLKELNVLLNLKYMIRRTKAEVLNDLAEKTRETIVLDPSLIWCNEAIKQSLSEVAKNLVASKGHERDEILLKFYAQTAEVKVKAVCAYIKQLLKESRKFIVFAHHRVMINAVCDCLDKLNVDYIRIDGSTRKEDRGEFIEKFQNKSTCLVAVLSLGACNAGISLTAADLILFAELTWNPSTLAQAESRAHRIGQNKSVVCRYLMASKTADDHIWQMLKSKQDVLNTAGIFCENLQDATCTAGPLSSQKIDDYFTPTKKMKLDESCYVIDNKTEYDNDVLKKELENIEDFFQDDIGDF